MMPGHVYEEAAALGQGRGSPEDVQVGLGDWERGQGKAEVESSAVREAPGRPGSGQGQVPPSGPK